MSLTRRIFFAFFALAAVLAAPGEGAAQPGERRWVLMPYFFRDSPPERVADARSKIGKALLVYLEESRVVYHMYRCDADLGEECFAGDPDNPPCGPDGEQCPRENLREDLLLVHRNAFHVAPGDPWIVGQTVFSHVKAGRYDEAAEFVERCEADAWWCDLLRGFVLYSSGEIGAAVEAFEESLLLMPERERCAWEDLRWLVDPAMRGGYAFQDCDERIRANARLWWLADPLHLTPFNERRAAHLYRMAWARLHDDLRERVWTEWSIDDWEGHSQEHHDSLVVRGPEDSWYYDTPSPRIYTSLAGARHQFFPKEHAAQDPLRARPDDWELSPNRPWERYTVPALPFFHELDQQVAVFARDDSVLVEAATDLALSPLRRAPERWGVLVLSRHELDERRMARIDGMRTRYLFEAKVPRDRYLASIEIVSPGRAAGRARLGVGLPEGPEQRVGVSDLMVFDASGDSLPADLAEARTLMLGRSRISPAEEVGLFWEVYGVEEEEAIEVSLVARREGLLARLGQVVGLVSDNVAIGWTDQALRAEGIYPRAVFLDLAALDPGDYTFELTVSAAGQEPFVVTRRVEVLDIG